MGEPWHQQAACRDKGPATFFPVPVGANKPKTTRRVNRPDPWEPARAICTDCPVQATCLEHHILETDGMWGNTTPDERKQIRAALGLTIRPGARGYVYARRTA